MKRSKFMEAQIAFILRQAEEGTAVERCAASGISEATYYSWRKKYDGLEPSDMKRLNPKKVYRLYPGDGPAITHQNTEAPGQGKA
jgi:hypothetical protein